jgi:DNA polymerase elongation subunit (family B)
MSLEKFQIFDIVSTQNIYGCSEQIFIGKNEFGTLKIFSVTKVPYLIYVATSNDSDIIMNIATKLNEVLRKKKRNCRSIYCKCPKLDFIKKGIYREPCINDINWYPDSPVVKIDLIRGFGYETFDELDRPFIKFTLENDSYGFEAKKFLQNLTIEDLDINYTGVYGFEKNMLESTLLNLNIKGFDWITFPQNSNNTCTYDQIKVSTPPNGFTNVFTTFNFDIEVLSKTYKHIETLNGDYPIGLIVYCFEGVSETLLLKSPFVNEESPNLSSSVILFDSEVELLLYFKSCIIKLDPDYFTGYNISNYDIPYILKRAKRLNIPKFEFMSRLENHPIIISETIDSKGCVRCIIDCPGRVVMDLLDFTRQVVELPKYTLDFVSKHFGYPGKDDVETREIYPYFHDKEKRPLLVEYCKTDVLRVYQISLVTDVYNRFISSSEVYGVLVRNIVNDSFSYLGEILVRKFMLPEKIFIRSFNKFIDKKVCNAYMSVDGFEENDGKSYSGGHVMEPAVGYYNIGHVVVLDFASLYPSIISQFNIDCTTLLRDNQDKTDAVRCVYKEKTVSFFDDKVVPEKCFYFTKKRRGVMPRILDYLLSMRKTVKNKMKLEVDPVKIRILDSYQLVLKLTANKYYGYYGAPFGTLRNIACAISIATLGRYYIQYSKKTLLENIDFQTRFKLRVLYGDTDSLFIYLQTETYGNASLAANEIVFWLNETSGILPEKLKMALENIACSAIFYSKKKYVLTIEKSSGALSLKCAGLTSRSMVKFTSNIIDTILQKALIEKIDIVEYIIECVQKLNSTILDVYTNDNSIKTDELSNFEYSTALTKKTSEYKQDARHVAAAKQLEIKGMEVLVGNRILYYMCNVTNTADEKQSGYAVASDLIDGHTLNIECYAGELFRKLKLIALHFLPGHSLLSKEKFLYSLIYDNLDDNGAATKRPPTNKSIYFTSEITTKQVTNTTKVKNITTNNQTTSVKKARQMPLEYFFKRE